MGSDIGQIMALGADLLFFTLFYSWYRRTNKSADEIKAAHTYSLDQKLVEKVKSSSDGCLPYACVQGKVLPVGQILHSKHVEGQSGVIQHIGLDEHKSKKLQGIWTDVKNSIRDTVQTVPFMLRSFLSGAEPVDIHVEEAKSANYLLDDLTITHDSLEPVQGVGFLSRTMDRLTGEVVKGYHETKKMLLTNTVLLGIGEIRDIDGNLVLRPPVSGSRFVLTTRSKAEVIKSMESKSFWIKVFVVGTGVIGASIFCNIMYKTYKRNQADRERRQTLAEMRELRQRAVAEREMGGGEGGEDSDQTCVVCLSNPRDIVLLNCGHICLCVDCVSGLPEPLACPVCRQPVERYITTYRP